MRFYIIHRSGDYFNGFEWRHPGTQPTGTEVARWDTRRAWLLKPPEVKATEKALRALNEDGFTTSSVDL